MTVQDATTLVDVQAETDGRNVPIKKVGVKKIRIPIAVKDRGETAQHTVGTISVSVDLPHHSKGTHMSRMMQTLNEDLGEISPETLPGLLDTMRDLLEAETAYLHVAFPFFMRKAAPVTGRTGTLSYDCSFEASSGAIDDFVLTVNVPMTSLCPCSKEISARGAHNQRGMATVRARSNGPLWIEDLVRIVDDSASCDLYPILKREDEKWVTEKAYDNPRFVEDLVREVTVRLREIESITWFSVEITNFESIHEHDTFAVVEEGERPC